MEVEKLTTLLEKVKSGEIEVNDALQSLRTLPFEDLGFTKIDHHRQLRTGFPEVIFCEGKTDSQVATISERILNVGHPLLATRATPAMYEAVKTHHPDARYNELGRTISVVQSEQDGKLGVLVISAGTSDLPVAEEAAETAYMLGSPPERLYDVGVAGLHRLISNHEKLLNATSYCRGCRNGRRITKCCWRFGGHSRHRCADKYRLWCQFWWTCCIAWYVKQLCIWSNRRQH